MRKWLDIWCLWLAVRAKPRSRTLNSLRCIPRWSLACTYCAFEFLRITSFLPFSNIIDFLVHLCKHSKYLRCHSIAEYALIPVHFLSIAAKLLLEWLLSKVSRKGPNTCYIYISLTSWRLLGLQVGFTDSCSFNKLFLWFLYWLRARYLIKNCCRLCRISNNALLD